MEYKLTNAVWELTMKCNMRCQHCGSSCEDAMPDGTLKTKSTVIHAESNALFYCAKTNTIADGATMY